MRRVFAVVAVVVAALPFACIPKLGGCMEFVDSCASDRAKLSCRGPVVTSSSDPHEEPCAEGSRCVENFRSNGRSYAACAIGDIDPKCNRDEDIAYCDGNTRVRCKGHYREEVSDCADEVCAEHDAQARCVRSLDPHPACNSDAGAFDPRFFCEGEVQFACFGPYAEKNEDCAAEAKFCRVVLGVGACRLQSEPDPRCNDLQNVDHHCDGDVAVRCVVGWREATIDCGAEGERCVESTDADTNVTRVRCE